MHGLPGFFSAEQFAQQRRAEKLQAEIITAREITLNTTPSEVDELRAQWETDLPWTLIGVSAPRP